MTLAKGRTVSGAVALAAHARGRGWGLVVSSDGDDGDAFAAHLAVGLRAGQFRAGGLQGAEHAAKYNALLRLATGGQQVAWAGADFRVA